MDWIDKRKINKYIVIAVLFLSFGFAGWQSTRGMLAYLSYSYPSLGQPAWLFNDVMAVLLGGAVPLLFYELITMFVARFAAPRLGGAEDSMKYALRFFYIAANIVIGLIKLFYFTEPAMAAFGNVLIDFIVTTAFFAWFLQYSAKHYVQKQRWGVMLLTVGGSYLVAEALVIVLGMLMGVVA